MAIKKMLILSLTLLLFSTMMTATQGYTAGRYTATGLGTLGGQSSMAHGINYNGQVVGASFPAGSPYDHAFLYSGGAMTDLGTLGGTTSRAAGINTNGKVVGSSTTAGDDTYHAFLYNGGAMTDLGTLGGTFALPMGINNSGQLVGYSYPVGNASYHAFLYSNGTMTDLIVNGLIRLSDWENLEINY